MRKGESHESWVRVEDGMINTIVLVLRDGVVHVSDPIMPELGLTATEFPEVVHPHKESFVRAVPYDRVVGQLEHLGWARVDPA